MHVLLFTIGFTEPETLNSHVRRLYPALTRVLKDNALLLPSGIQRALLTGYSRERRLPSGLGFLSAMLKRSGHSVELADRLVDPDAWPSDIHAFDFVGIHTTTPCYRDGLNVLERLKAEGFKGKIAFGGPHTALYPDTVPSEVDYLVQGEAEYVICDLVEGAYPTNSLIVTPRIRDLDALPQVDYSLFMDRPRSYELVVPFFEGRRVVNMTTSRSCPWQCTFCSTKSIWGRLWTRHGPERIIDDIRYLKSTYQIDGIYFREDLFTADKKRVYEFCELVRKNALEVRWAIETRASDACDSELVAAMAGAGCRGFYIGAESGSQRMLDKYVKEATVEQTVQAVATAKRFGIKTAMSLIVGNPEETFADRYASYKIARRCKPEILQTSVFNGAHTGLNALGFKRYAVDERQVIRVDQANGSWSGQKDRKMRVAV